MRQILCFKALNVVQRSKKLSLISKNIPVNYSTHASSLDTTKSQYQLELEQSLKSPREYWQTKVNLIEWHEKPKGILDDSKSPFDKWFYDGKVNATYNCLDIHVKNGHGDQIALIHDSPMTNTIEKISYKQLLKDVSHFAGALVKHGVQKGDRVLIYMPMIPQAVVAMLASARIGAIHSLVFGGFASKELATRINHAKPKIIVSANTGVEPGRLVNYKELLENAINLSDHKPSKCIFYNRLMFPRVEPSEKRDFYLDFAEELAKARAHDCVPVDSNFPLYLLYTSGTTGTPKAVVRSTAGYIISLKNSMKAIYGVNPGETWWAFSDLGWTVGHSFVCYGPLAARNTSVIYEGKPVGTPDSGAIFRVMSEHQVVSMFIAPTALRAIHQNDPKAILAKKYPLKQYLFVAGEHCDHETMNWTKNIVRKPVFDHWWQTETGWPITSMCAGIMNKHELESVPVGVSGKAVPGYDIRVLKEDNTEAQVDELGRIVIKLPLPPGTILSLWENDELFNSLYFKQYPGYYDTADVGMKCKNGYITVLSRADDVINVAGHRISSSAIEEAILEHDELSECAVVELKDSLKGVVPFGFLIKVKDSQTPDKELLTKVYSQVRSSIGPVASFKQAVVIDKLPKTRSGKIARNTLKAMINNKPFKIPVTIEDANVYAEIKKVLLKNNFKDVSDPTP